MPQKPTCLAARRALLRVAQQTPNLDHTACRVYESKRRGIAGSRRLKTVPRPSPARGPRARADGSTLMNAEPFSMTKPKTRLGRIAILWRGDEAARRTATPDAS